MEVIAKTASGLMIQATEEEVKAILNAVNGVRPEKVEIGQKIPAIDYAATISKIKALKNNWDYTNMLEQHAKFSAEMNKLKMSVEKASDINV
jgi:hypothetical protein